MIELFITYKLFSLISLQSISPVIEKPLYLCVPQNGAKRRDTEQLLFVFTSEKWHKKDAISIGYR